MGAETHYPGTYAVRSPASSDHGVADEPMVLRLEDCESLKFHAGLNLEDACDGAESDDTSAKSLSIDQSSLSHSVNSDLPEYPQFEAESPMYVLMSGQSHTKVHSSLKCRPLASMRSRADSPESTNAHLPTQAAQPNGTKLSAKAASFRPLPFVPMSEVKAAWQNWSDSQTARQSKHRFPHCGYCSDRFL
jgi:hypothetical protein